jgi:hypothetical protein
MHTLLNTKLLPPTQTTLFARPSPHTAPSPVYQAPGMHMLQCQHHTCNVEARHSLRHACPYHLPGWWHPIQQLRVLLLLHCCCRQAAGGTASANSCCQGAGVLTVGKVFAWLMTNCCSSLGRTLRHCQLQQQAAI